MSRNKGSSVIYGDGPFIEDMGVLTTFCLLHDEILLFGDTDLDNQLSGYRHESIENGHTDRLFVVEDALRFLRPEGLITFLSPEDALLRYPDVGKIVISGVDDIEVTAIEGKTCVVLKQNEQEQKHNSGPKIIIKGGSGSEGMTVSSLLRELSLLGVAVDSQLPIISSEANIRTAHSTTRVPEVATFLAHRTLQLLALPELSAYHAEDILEARLGLKSELQDFRAGILELVWLLHQCSNLSGDLSTIRHDCDILIDTKISSAVLSLEKAISNHKSKMIRRILKATSGALMELGKCFIAPTLPGVLLGGSGALLKIADSFETQKPTVQVASFVYKVREKQF